MAKGLIGIAVTQKGERISFRPPLNNGSVFHIDNNNAVDVLSKVLGKGHISIEPLRVKVKASQGVETNREHTYVWYRPSLNQRVHLSPAIAGQVFEGKINRKKVKVRSLHLEFVELPRKLRKTA